jgi:hypothetical protein
VSATIRGEAKPTSGDSLLDTLPGTGPTESGPVTDPPPPSIAYSDDSATPPAESTPTGDADLSLGASPTAAPVPDLSLPAPTGATAALPPVVAAVNPPAARGQTAPPQIALVQPASIGRGLRDDDFSGLYLVLGGIGALATVAAFLLAGGRRRAATATSVLRLPNT